MSVIYRNQDVGGTGVGRSEKKGREKAVSKERAEDGRNQIDR